MLSVENAGFLYAKQEDPVFDGLSFRLDAGESLCILGPNGVGKTTLLRCLAGLVPLSRGTVRIDGTDVSRMGRRRVARMLAYVPQFHQPVFAYSVFDMVLMGRSPHVGFLASPTESDRAIAGESLRIIGIEHLSAKAYTEISGGERQLVMFARVLAQKPRILLLDEPTAHLDFGNQVQVLALVKRMAAEGILVVMTSHTPDHAFMAAGKAALMRSGEMRFGPPSRVLNEQDLSAVYGVDIRVVDAVPGIRTCIPLMPGETRHKGSSDGTEPGGNA